MPTIALAADEVVATDPPADGGEGVIELPVEEEVEVGSDEWRIIPSPDNSLFFFWSDTTPSLGKNPHFLSQ